MGYQSFISSILSANFVQRREARRKKILENAKNRLERLNGRTTSSTTPTTTTSTDLNEEKSKHEHISGK